MKKVILLILIPLSILSKNIEHRNFLHINQNNGLVSNRVLNIQEDNLGRLWIQNDYEFVIYDGTKIISLNKLYPQINLKKIYNIFSYKDNMFFANDIGIFCFNYMKGELKNIIPYASSSNSQFFVRKNSCYILYNNKIYKYHNGTISENLTINFAEQFVVDSDLNIWIKTENEIKCYKQKGIQTYKIENTDIQSNFRTSILFSDKNGNVWLTTRFHGLFRYKPQSNKFVQANKKFKTIDNICSIANGSRNSLIIGHNKGYISYDYVNQELNYNSLVGANSKKKNITVSKIMLTKNKDILIGSYFNGVFIVKTKNEFLKFIDLTNQNSSGVVVNNIVHHKNLVIVATNNSGVFFFDKNQKYKKIKNINYSNSKLPNNIISLCTNNTNELFLGSLSGEIFSYNMNTNIVKKIIDLRSDKNISNSIVALDSISKTEIAICVYGNVYRYNTITKKKLKIYESNSIIFDTFRTNNTLWICNNDEVLKINLTNNKVEKYHPKPKDKLISFYIENDTVWVGTKNNSIQYFTSDKQIHNYDNIKLNRAIYSIYKDKKSQFWLATQNGLFLKKYNKPAKKFNIEWALNTNRFNWRSNLFMKNTVFFGSTNGICYFTPNNYFESNVQSSNLFLTDFRILEESQIDNNKFFKSSIHNLKEIELEYSQNIFSFDFSILNFNFSCEENYKIEYKLEGFNEHWFKLEKPYIITYTSLSSGKYNLKVRLLENGNIIEHKNFIIKIKPHVLVSIPIIILYFLILILIIFFIIKFHKNRENEKLKIKLLKLKQEEIEKLNNSKLNFFTFISYELKRPLTIISALIENIFNDANTKDSKEYKLSKYSIGKTMNLIDQLIEFRKIETSFIKAKKETLAINSHMELIIDVFSPLFEQKEISPKFNNTNSNLIIETDVDYFEKIISNITNYLIKHSEPKSFIIFNITKGLNQQIELSIETDKYIGNYLTKDYYNELFEKINMSEGGIETNIGLANAIKLSKIIGSKINIIQKNENNIKFSFEFKSSNLTTTKNNKLKHKITIPKTLNNSPIDLYKDLSKSDNKNNFEKPKLLIVDKDNNYIMSLKLNLNKHYRVYHTSSGTIALDHIKNKMIDFVITDIDTKDIGGFELCTTIRNHPKFKHLPIIISSISNSIDNKIKTYDLSANFYIQKPFHIEELINKIKSIEKNKTSLKSHLSNINSIETIEKTSNKQEVFISEMKEIILENLSNQEFGVISLAQKMKISRTQLYMQCKEITNITPSELITNIKLKHAKIMLNDHKLTISEIAYKLGYNSANYFGKQFKNHFGKTPREYRG